MELEIIKVDMSNLTKVIMEQDLYVITNYRILGMRLMPIARVAIEDILSEKNLVVRITTK